MTFSDLFYLESAKSKGIDEYEMGNVAFITNTTLDNGVGGYVEPVEGDRIFFGPAICISGLGFATVHLGEFLPKGNGGDSLTVLKPKKEMKNEELLFYAAVFNMSHEWRFSFGRKAGIKKIACLEIPLLFDKYKDEVLIILENYSKEIMKSTRQSIKKFI